MIGSSQTLIDQSSLKLQIFLNGRNLGDLDFFSKSDPYVKLYFKRSQSDQNVTLIGRTETINNNLNPNFSKSFVLDYIFQQHQFIRFEVWDDDGGSDQLIGYADTSLGALAGAKNQTSIIQLNNLSKPGKDMGKLIVRCDNVQDGNQYALVKFKAVKLMNTDSYFDWWDKSDPYLKFMKIRSDNTYLCVKQTEVIDNCLNPSWRTLELPLHRLVNQRQRKFRIQCWDHEDDIRKHNYIGDITVNIDQLLSKPPPHTWKLFNPKHSNPGSLVLEQIQVFTKPNFTDYLRGGLELNLIVAIDFTGSNGSPSSPQSLHYMDPNKPNQYQTAIRAVGNILLNYDSDKLIPAFGFGGKPHFPNFYQTVANHCFPLTGDLHNFEAEGLPNLQQMYAHCLMNVELAGPTYFTPLINEAIKLARTCKQEGSNTYQILLILTDGQIHDMETTVDLIVANTDVPLSIIIVGLGNADFGRMERLDGDNGLYDSQGRKAGRDIVQFVPFRQVGSNPAQLSKELLAELPTQIVQYMVPYLHFSHSVTIFQTMIGKPAGPPLNVSVNGLMNTEVRNKNVAMVDDMFKKANFFDKFMNPQQPAPQEGSNMNKPIVASVYKSSMAQSGTRPRMDYPE